MSRGTLFSALLAQAAAAVLASAVMAGTTTTNVTTNIAGQGAVNIGTITIDPNGIVQGANTFITAEFVLGPGFAYLDEWYDFQWINIETGFTVDGNPVDADGDGNPDDPVVGELPAVDPQPLAAGGDDNAPFYWTPDEFGTYHTEGVSSSWHDDRSSSQGVNDVISFTTYLVAVSITDTTISGNTLCVLASFSWTSTTGTGAGESVEAVTGTTANAGAADAATINTALANAGGGGFPGGWTANADCTLSECPFVIDCIYSTIPGVNFSPSTWTNNGTPIGMTFVNGKTPEVGVPQYDGTYLPVDANDWHWSVTIPCEGTSTEVSVWVENFTPGTTISVGIVCSAQYVAEPSMLMVDVGNNSYQLLSGRTLLYQGQWSAYPNDIPPSLGFAPTGAARANFVACDPNARCAADFDANGFVDGADLAVLLGGWNTIGGTDLTCDGRTDGADLAVLLGSWGQCTCGNVELTQSASPLIEPNTGVLCIDDVTGFSTDNQYARSFNLATLPQTAGHAFGVTCIDVGIEGNSGSNLVCTARLFLDVDGGQPIAPGVDLVELGSDALLVREASGGGTLQARFNDPVVLPPNSVMVVVLDCPPHYDGRVAMGANNDGESAPTYIRALACGVPQFVPLAALGFPNSHWVVRVHGDVIQSPFPSENRGIASVLITPAGPSGYLIRADWRAESLSPGFSDLSSDVHYFVNGLPVGQTTQQATTLGASGTCLGSSPPCDGSACGTWDFGFGTLNGFCGESIAGQIGLHFCTCGCAVLTTAPTPVLLHVGDVVTVQLTPAPGSLPEQFTADDVLTVIFSGAPGCPGTGPCNVPHPSPGCSDATCCSAVCGQFPQCCEIAWDVQCVQLATFLCN